MAEEQAQSSGQDPASAPADQDIVLELNFVPSWARKPPGPDYYDSRVEEKQERPRGRRRGDSRDYRSMSDRRGRGARPEKPGKRQPRRGPTQQRDPQRQDASDRSQRRPARRTEPVDMPHVQIRFIPDQKRLTSMVRQLSTSNRSYPLMELVYLFFSKPEYCHVKIESERNSSGITLFQCKVCRMVAVDRSQLSTHLVKSHVEEYFEKEETVVVPTAGQFV